MVVASLHDEDGWPEYGYFWCKQLSSVADFTISQYDECCKHMYTVQCYSHN